MTGRHQVGPNQGRLVLRTYREGLAAQVGHDLLIEVTHWSAGLNIPADLSTVSVTARVDTTSLVVREGTGGIQPLSDRDRREIVQNARKSLDADHRPEATFTSTRFTRRDGGGVLDGTLILRGVQRPLRLTVTELGDNSYRATATVKQTDHGIKPYSAFFGTLRLRDAVEIEVNVRLSDREHSS